jgi:hypothetical protein
MFSVEQIEVEAPSRVVEVSKMEVGKGKPFRYKTLALTSDYLEADAMKLFGATLSAKELRWRHNKLEDKPESFLGIVDSVDFDMGKNKEGKDVLQMWTTNTIHNETDEQEEAIKLVQESMEKGEPIGHSVGYIKIADDDSKKIVRVFFRELSMTPYPKCSDCRKSSVANEQYQTIEEALMHATEAKSVTNEQTAGVSAQQFEAVAKKLETSMSLLENQIKKVEDEKRELQKKIVESEVTSKEFEKKITAAGLEVKRVTEENKGLRVKVVGLEDKCKKLTTIPQRIRLAQYEGITKPEQIQTRIRELESDTTEQLADKIKSARGIIQRMEVKGRASSPARIAGSQQEGTRASSMSAEEEISATSPEKLAEKYYGV